MEKSAIVAQIEAVVAKISGYKRPNSKLALQLLESLDQDYVLSVDASIELLEEYRDISVEDYDNAEEFSDARHEAWTAFVDSLDDIEVDEDAFDDDEEDQSEPKYAMIQLGTELLSTDICTRCGHEVQRHDSVGCSMSCDCTYTQHIFPHPDQEEVNKRYMEREAAKGDAK